MIIFIVTMHFEHLRVKAMYSVPGVGVIKMQAKAVIRWNKLLFVPHRSFWRTDWDLDL
jgi:hypothetical protein